MEGPSCELTYDKKNIGQGSFASQPLFDIGPFLEATPKQWKKTN